MVRRSGVFFNKRDNREYAYFADAISKKKLLCFTPDGTLVDSVSLNAAADSLKEIDGISVIDMDSIVLTSADGFDLALIDHRGRVFKTMDLRSALRASDGAQFEVWASPSSTFVIDGCAYLHVSLLASSLAAPDPPSENPFDEVYNFYKRRARAPFLVKVDLRHKDVAPSWGVDSLFFRINPHNPLTPCAGDYECLNNLIFVHSIYSPSVVVVEPTQMREVATFKIRSREKKTHVWPIQMKNGVVPNFQDSGDVRYRRGAYVISITYDQPTHHYLLALTHALDDSALGPEKGGVRSYSFLEYDDRFQFIREWEIADGKYQPYFVLALKKGSYMRRELGQRADMRGIHRFVRLDLHEAH